MNDKSHILWRDKAEALAFETRPFIDGHFNAPSREQTYACLNPATDRVIAEVARCTAEDVDGAVEAAKRSFDGGGWARSAPEERKQVLLRLADLILENREELALLDTLCMGKPISDTYHGDVPGAAAVFRWYAEAADKMYDSVAPTANTDLALIRRVPVGVVGAVIPWNFPLDIAAWKVAPALIAGNSVVLKPAEQSPLSALLLARLARDAGLPAGVLNVVTGFGEEVGEPMGRHEGIDCIAFTGSTETGARFLRYSSDSNSKMIWLECGGKSANLIFSDCRDLRRAAQYAAQAIFTNQGAVCSANSRLLVQADIHDDFMGMLLEEVPKFRPGDPLDERTRMGAIVDGALTDKIMTYVELGHQEGAKLLTGGRQLQVDGKGCFVEPTVFTEATSQMRICHEEIFGPVLSVMTFSDEADAINKANDSPYGLAASLWTDDLRRAHRVSDALLAGTVSVNTVDAISPVTPFGGFKRSGYGRDLSLYAIDKFCHRKTVWMDLAGPVAQSVDSGA
ncbi:MAG TPA: aldehyde dehydrogenase [Gammaproteobacteria bacterium]|nr:aldehyde dehydrogenase [Gammaproteobacteria bacterium]